MIAEHPAAASGNLAVRDHLVVAAEIEFVRHRLVADLQHPHRDVEHILEPRRSKKIAGSRHAREADPLPFPRHRDGEAERAEELDLGRLHEPEKIGEVDNARNVSIGKLDTAVGTKRSYLGY